MRPSDDRAPDLGPRYEYVRELGRGGVGRVLLVRDRHLEKDVALKLLREPPSADELEAFRREFVLLSEIEHPGIARAFDFGYLNGVPFFTSEFVAGEGLPADGGTRDVDRTLAHAREIADALAFLHREGIVHLDIKPSNILVPETPEAGPAVLIDFGLFRRGFKGPPGKKIQGSLPYMAPEYFRDEELGPWTDVYAFGVTLYRALTGRFPRSALEENVEAAFEPSVWEPAPLLPSRLSPGLPGDLDHLLLKCLALDPASRFPSAAELLPAIERITRSGGASRHGAKGETSATVGREAELDRFEAYLEGVLERAAGSGAASEEPPLALLVTGGPGMGQSHLLREMKVRAQTRGVPFYLETGYPGQPTAPGALLRCLAAQLEDRSDRTRWESFLSRLNRPRRSSRNETSEDERRLRRAGEIALAAASIKKPFILAVDGLQFWDEVSVGSLVDLLRFLGEKETASRPPLGLILAYREEGPSVAALRELTDDLSPPGRCLSLTLRPLALEETWKLYRRMAGDGGDESRGFRVFQETGGVPAKIAGLAASRRPQPASAASPVSGQRSPGRLDLDREAKRLLLILELLRRPTRTAELARLSGVPRGRLVGALRNFLEHGLVSEGDTPSRSPGWLIEPGAAELTREAGVDERSRLHRRIATELSRTVRPASDPRIVEVALHARAAEMPAAVVKYGLAAARYLKSTFQNRAALEEYRATLDAIPLHRRKLRVEVALELAALQVRIGDLQAGIECLKEILGSSGGLGGAARARILLWLAILHSRKGDFRRAARLFAEGFACSKGGKATRAGAGDLEREERLFFLNELASLKTFTGDYEEAMDLCEEGFRMAGRGRSFQVKELVLNLHATRGNVLMRTFDYEGATRELEACLEIAETIGSPANQAVILNNLGILHGNCDRYREAIQAYREAERISMRLDEGPSLISIYGNLAILYSKTGEYRLMNQSLAEAERLGAAAMGRKPELFLEHARGLSRIYEGRYDEARSHLEAAIRLGNEIGDLFLVSFDAVYLAEALLFTGAYDRALRELARLRESEGPGCVRGMALARLALLHAFTGRRQEVEHCASELAERREERPVPFVDAWNDLYLGWALSVVSLEAVPLAVGEDHETRAEEEEKKDPVRRLLERAQAFFELHGVVPGLALSRWVLAERSFLQGDVEAAREVLRSCSTAGSDFTAVLTPLLGARLAGESAASAQAVRACGDLLAEAGEKLIGNPLPEWNLRLLGLRNVLRPERKSHRGQVEAERRELGRKLSREERRGYLESFHWKRWVRDLSIPRSALRVSRDPEPSATPGTSPLTRTAFLEREGVAVRREELVTRSRVMQDLMAVLDRIRRTDLPVLIQGETGSGKETVARIIHRESARSAQPFVVVDCAAIPEGLVEAELFGARAGAFTDLEKDRPGLLSAADGGTVLIDEIASIPLGVQTKLLRVIAGKSFRRLGDESEIFTDARFLFSSSLPLEEAVEQGRLREDFVHRVQVLTVHVAPLRERVEDLPELVRVFLGEAKQTPPPTIEDGVLERLSEELWPGNVRELRNLIARLRLENTRRISLEALERQVGGKPKRQTLFPNHLLARKGLGDLKERLEKDYILYHLHRLKGDTTALSHFLEISRVQLYRRCHRLGIRLRGRKRG